MKIALIGQSAFGKAVLEAILKHGRDEIAGVFAPPDKEGRPADPIKEAAVSLGVRVHQFKRMRNQDAIG
ncbi:MAG: methionyl-tRNA formyltransferase, partial [Dehalococcoidia bacterium]